MKRIIAFLALIMVSFSVVQAGNDAFNPKRFQADLEAYITKYAELSPKQAEKFLPIFREMRQKLQVLFVEKRQCECIDKKDDAACARAIQRMDNIDVQLKKIQKTYHQKFLAVLPASVVMKIIKAEDRFHRQAFRKVIRGERHSRL